MIMPQRSEAEEFLAKALIPPDPGARIAAIHLRQPSLLSARRLSNGDAALCRRWPADPSDDARRPRRHAAQQAADGFDR